MTTLTFTLAASQIEDGRWCVHMYIRRDEPTNTELVYRERKAMDDAEQIIRDIVTENLKDDPLQLLAKGDIPDDALPIFAFCLGVSWDRSAHMAHYSRVDYRRLMRKAKWTKVATLGMELYDETFGVIRKRENADRKRRAIGKAKTCAESTKAAKERFNAYCDVLLPNILKRYDAELRAEKRAECPNRTATNYCSPIRPNCPYGCYCNGRCMEVEVVRASEADDVQEP